MWRQLRQLPQLSRRLLHTRRGLRSDQTFVTGTSSAYIESLYEQWKADPKSVHGSWAAFFNLDDNGASEPYVRPSTLGAPLSALQGLSGVDQVLQEHVRVNRLIRNFQTRGHRLANLDPLGIDVRSSLPELSLDFYGFIDSDLDRTFTVPATPALAGRSTGFVTLTLREIIERMKAAYCGNIGWEYMFIQDKALCSWLREHIEDLSFSLTPEEKRVVLADLIQAESFESTLNLKFQTDKRFGLEGAESLIPGLKALIRKTSELGTESVIIGMAHRGRLNVLHNVIYKRMEVIFKEFKGIVGTHDGSGDVKYHVGMNNNINIDGRSLYASLMANPSHLEAVNPVVLGRVRAMQTFAADEDRKKVLGLLVHGDGALAGQGVCFESMGMTALRDFCTGGTIHVVINNQVAFTTDPRHSRSSDYCTDIAKFVEAPIFHVNADKPVDVIRCFKLAAAWQKEHGRDVVIDLVGYRRNGHNEMDQPRYTQPIMYSRIAKHPKILTLYRKALEKEGLVTEDEVENMVNQRQEELNKAFENLDNHEIDRSEYLPLTWKNWTRDDLTPYTGVSEDILKEIAVKGCEYPSDFTVLSTLKGILSRRQDSVLKGEGIDWATAEMLAFGSLLWEQIHVRLSGQDVERGTFSQRHHVLHDQEVYMRRHTPLTALREGQAQYTVCNSHLSEFAVLGFELGYSLQAPNQLVLWEAQFGDFANGASIIIDNFLASGEVKWGPQTGLVVLLPHGYEGMGPEHSSCRLERFLQLSGDDEQDYPESLLHDPTGELQIKNTNWQVANCTTPANYFHVLRRQLNRNFRKPLVIATPKSLLRLKEATSTLAEMTGQTAFQRVLGETDRSLWAGEGSQNPDIKRVVFCSGKVYYELAEARSKEEVKDVVFCRVEQISPFPFDLVHKFADHFPNAEITWCQEEPKNMGAWSYVRPRLETALSKSEHHAGKRPRYAGRAPSAATATGDKNTHKREIAAFLRAALH
eukprot:m.64629 g.64629  ORF g.64629 m.64629 type:complete len:978 (+) comp16441_c0_seq1:1467-4400(+)